MDADVVNAKITEINNKQILLLGSQKTYERISKNLQEMRFEPHFAKEQFNLYSWRKDFFHKHFPRRSWCSDGNNDYDIDVIPYEITKNFDSVVEQSCSTDSKTPKFLSEAAAEPEIFGIKASSLFDKEVHEYLVFEQGDEDFLYGSHSLGWPGALLVCLAVYPLGPAPLQVLAGKTVVAAELPLLHLPVSIQHSLRRGMFRSAEDIAGYITDRGKQKLKAWWFDELATRK